MIRRTGQPHKDYRDPIPERRSEWSPVLPYPVGITRRNIQRAVGGVLVSDSPDRERTR